MRKSIYKSRKNLKNNISEYKKLNTEVSQQI